MELILIDLMRLPSAHNSGVIPFPFKRHLPNPQPIKYKVPSSIFHKDRTRVITSPSPALHPRRTLLTPLPEAPYFNHSGVWVCVFTQTTNNFTYACNSAAHPTVEKPIHRDPVSGIEADTKPRKINKRPFGFAGLQMSTALVQRPRYRNIYLLLVTYG